MEKIKIFKDNTRIAVKLFIMVWVVLLVHVLLKVTFNYWQPYVIPNEQLQYISNFIDNHKILIIILDSLFYIFNGYIMICCSLQKWHLGKKLNILTLILLVLGYLWGTFVETTIFTIFLSIVYPLILNYKKWKYILLTFILNNLFLILSLWLCETINIDTMPYIVNTLFVLDYYIMLVLNYFVFNFLRIRKGSKNGS